MKVFKKIPVVLISILLCFIALGISPTYANNTGSIWTTDSTCTVQDKNHYAKGEEVWIAYRDFDPGDYPWKIEGQPGQASTDPGEIVAQGSRTVTSTDKDCFNAYTVNDDDAGEYHVTFNSNKHDNYNVDKDDANVSVSIGACSPNSPTTPVTLTIMGAVLTINGEDYDSTVVIYLPPGVYPYSWVAKTGYEGSGNGSITINECTPPDATASISIGACSFTAGTGSLTSVSITLDNASLTINSVTYTSSTTIDLSPGVYPYIWVALTGYQGSGSGTLVIGGCVPKQAEATVSTGPCSYTLNEGSLTPVTLTLFGAELTINEITYFQSTTISLEPGIYPYTWTGTEGYTGSGEGSITIFSCEPKLLNEVEVSIGACAWTEQTGSLTPVTLTIVGASLTITDAALSDYGSYTTTQIIQLPPGEYIYSFVPLEGYEGEGDGSFTIGSCIPGFASVSFAIGSCGYETAQGSLTQVRITLFGATVNIDGKTYPEAARLVETEEIVIYLGPGVYPYTWEAIDGFEGNGSGELVIGNCNPTPSYSPATGSTDNPIVFTLIGAVSLLISVVSLLVWKKIPKGEQ